MIFRLYGSGFPGASDLILLVKVSQRSYYDGDLQEISTSFLCAEQPVLCPALLHVGYAVRVLAVLCLERLTQFECKSEESECVPSAHMVSTIQHNLQGTD